MQSLFNDEASTPEEFICQISQEVTPRVQAVVSPPLDDETQKLWFSSAYEVRGEHGHFPEAGHLLEKGEDDADDQHEIIDYGKVRASKTFVTKARLEPNKRRVTMTPFCLPRPR